MPTGIDSLVFFLCVLILASIMLIERKRFHEITNEMLWIMITSLTFLVAIDAIRTGHEARKTDLAILVIIILMRLIDPNKKGDRK